MKRPVPTAPRMSALVSPEDGKPGTILEAAAGIFGGEALAARFTAQRVGTDAGDPQT